MKSFRPDRGHTDRWTLSRTHVRSLRAMEVRLMKKNSFLKSLFKLFYKEEEPRSFSPHRDRRSRPDVTTMAETPISMRAVARSTKPDPAE